MGRRDLTWDDLEGENAFMVLGTIQRLLKQMDREAGTDLAKPYMKEAQGGDYEHLMEVSHRYAYEHLRTTLRVPEHREGEPGSVYATQQALAEAKRLEERAEQLRREAREGEVV